MMSAPTSFLDEKVILHAGDCLDVLRSMAENSVDSVCADPPYHLTSIVKRFGASNAAPAKEGKTGAYARASRGFMGKTWDGGDIAFRAELWAEVLRVLKPGGHVLAFSGTRTYHRMACAIEDGGFDIRDQIGWAFGSGFPKSHNLGNGRGTALKPAWEPICLARKPIVGTNVENVLAWGTGALNVDGCRVPTEIPRPGRTNSESRSGLTGIGGAVTYGSYAVRGSVAIEDTIQGRWPANLIHDGSNEVLAAFPQTISGKAVAGGHKRVASLNSNSTVNVAGRAEENAGTLYGDSGSAARFFYSAKADSDDRIGSKHPTVKPIDLMRYLVRLITPPGGTVLDMFAGTGTTGEAAWREGFSAILIEREAEYQADIARRMALCLAGPDERRRAIMKAKHGDVPANGLFSPVEAAE